MIPVWNQKIKPWIEKGDVQVLGIVQEQHAERARLYKQWKQYDFPIVQDVATNLDLTAVPIILFIDEFGVIQNARPSPNQLERFATTQYDAPIKQHHREVQSNDLLGLSIELLHQQKFDEAIEQLNTIVKSDSDNAKAQFVLGVSYRLRFDSENRQTNDFANASKYWSNALSLYPNQYIWRRRIQQYGPRLAKPYPFYDWVDRAIEEIKKRGEIPIVLKIPLSNSEQLSPNKNSQTNTSPTENPDPDSKIFEDKQNRINIQTAWVPYSYSVGDLISLHLSFVLQDNTKWNNEAGPCQIWIDNNREEGGDGRLIDLPTSKQTSSNEIRTVDFEYKTLNQPEVITGYLLFHCCDQDGVCYYLRKDFEIDLTRGRQK
ncbi:MAG: hypothetical protein AAGA30_16965 [Planctomycetota bacterium]